MEWTLANISEMVTSKIEESLNLDYKAAGALDRAKGNEIGKDVSAFANSAGGRIIYGIAEDPTNRHLPGKIDPIKRQDFSKEWLEAVIQSNIQPKIDGLIIHPVSVSKEEVVYIVEIPQSTTAHQSKDGRYYKRHNFSCQFMEDYEIRDVMNRSTKGKIELFFSLSLYTPRSEFPEFPPKKKDDLVELKVRAKNVGMVVANHIVIKLGIPNGIAHKQLLLPYFRAGGRESIPDYINVKLKNQKTDTSPMGNRLSDPRYEPILPELEEYLGSCILTDDSWITANQDLIVKWSIHVDDAPSRTGSTALREMKRIDARRE